MGKKLLGRVRERERVRERRIITKGRERGRKATTKCEKEWRKKTRREYG